jgi:transposase
MLRGGEILEIMELHRQGFSIREIARRTGFSRNTVKKALAEKRLWKYKPRGPIGSKLDPFKPYLEERIAVGVTNAIRLFAELQQVGYTGGYTLVREFLKPHRQEAKPVATVRFETRPGEQAQVDFGVFVYEHDGKRQRFYAFVLVLSYSRMLYVEFVEHQDLATLIRCHVHAFETLGIPQTILYDNMKTVVTGRDEEGKVVVNERFADFALAVGFTPRACRPYRPQTKGRVERSVGYLRQNFWPGRTFANLNDLNQQVSAWCKEANQRIHGTTGKRPCDLWEEEPLTQVSDPMLAARFALEERKVGRDGFVQFAGSRYGVPWQYAGQVVQVRETAAYIEILSKAERIAVHPKSLYAKSTLPLPGQYEGLSTANNRGSQVGSVAMQVGGPDVLVRPLTAYASLEGGKVH